MVIVELFLSSRHWEKAKLHEKNNEEEIRIITLQENDIFFEDEDKKLRIDFNSGKILVSKKLFFQKLKEHAPEC